MRVGIEAQRVFRTHKHGMDFVALELIHQLSAIDKVNEYFIFTNDGEDKDCLKVGSNFSLITQAASYPIWEQRLLPKWASEYKLDILHCTSNTAPIKCPVPLVVTIHDLIYFEKNPLFAKGYTPYQRFGNVYRRLVVRKLLHSADRIITVSEFEKKRFLKMFNYLTDKDVKVVYNGVGAHFRPDISAERKKEIRKKYNLPDKYILFLGNTDPKKNTKRTLEAWARSADEGLHNLPLVVGDLNKEAVADTLRKQGLGKWAERVHFPGYIHNQELPAIIASADLFLYPSKRESFGIPVLEGMACGTPVITSNVTSMPEVGADAAFYVDPLDVKSIVDAIGRVLSDEQLQKELREKGIKRAAEFNWKHSAEMALDVYKELHRAKV